MTTDYVAKDGIIPSLADSTGLLTAAFNATKGAAPAERLHRRRLRDLPGGGYQGRARS